MNGAGPRFAAETESPAFAPKPPRRRRFSLTRSKYSMWALPAFGLLLIAALWTRTWLQVRSIERANLQEITRETEILVDSYEQYTRNAIEEADRMALLVKYEYEQHGSPDLSGLVSAGVINGNSIVLVSIVDADGKLVASSQPLRPVNVADRAYFIAHKARDSGLLDISRPVVGRSSGRALIQLSRRMNHPDGSFAGIVLLSVAPDYFTRLYSNADFGSHSALSLVGRDGVLRARRIGNDVTSRDIGGGALLVARARAAPRGTYESTSSFDGVSRFVAYREMQDYPFIVTAGEARDEALAAFAQSRVRYIAVAAAATVIIVIFFALVTVLAVRLQRNRRELRRERQFLVSILDNIPAGVSVRSMQPATRGRYVMWNEACEAMFGIRAHDALGRTLSEMLAPELSAPLLALDEELLASPMVQETSEVIDVPNRGRRTFHLVRAPMLGGADEVDYIMSIATDVTDERARNDQLRLASKVFETTADAIMLSDSDDRVIMVNRGFEKLTGFTSADVLGQPVAQSPFRATDPAAYDIRMERLRREGIVTGEVQRVSKDGSLLALWITASCVRNAEGTIVNYVRVFSDISLLKTTQRKLEELASHDSLTGLPNRRLLQDRLALALQRARRNHTTMAVMFIDLDGFKAVNDTLGHDVGDLLLREVGARLSKCVRASDSVGRFGGDEFAIVLEDANLPHDAVVIGERIVAALAAPFEFNGHRVRATASIGVAVHPADGADAAALLKNADVAMYAAKKSGRNRFVFFGARSDEVPLAG
ncbi:MAG TPA: diguanylate cyclase [Casimicrobiaceae bacterium]